MRTIDRIYELCDSTGKTKYALCKSLGISQSTLSTWKAKENRDMDIEYLQKTAAFFRVSIDYLVTGHDAPSDRYTTEDEDKVLAMLRSLPERDRYIFLGRLQEAVSNIADSEEKRQFA